MFYENCFGIKLKLTRYSEHTSVDFTTTRKVKHAFVEHVRSDYNFRKRRTEMAMRLPRRMAQEDGVREKESEKRLTCSVIWVRRWRRRRSAVHSRPAPGFPSENFLSWLSPTFSVPPCAHRGRDLLCPFILPFLSSLSTHDRFTSRVKDTRPPVLYRDRSSGHDTALHTEFLSTAALRFWSAED